jgi:hypothetical protein
LIKSSQKWRLLFIACVVVLLSSYDLHSATAAPPATAPSRPPASTAPASDRSLPADEYITLGMPSYDREWVGQDMAVAAAKLQAMAKKSPEKLPRFGSNRSGPVFAENFNFFRSRSLPLGTRFPQFLDYTDALNAIVKLYASARTTNKEWAAELVELSGAMLRALQLELELVDELIPTLAKDDPTYSVRMAGLEKMRGGLALVISGSLTTLTETQVFDADLRAKLVDYCRETFPQILPRLTAASEQEMLRRLDELVDNPSVREFRDQVILLRDESHAATKARE